MKPGTTLGRTLLVVASVVACAAVAELATRAFDLFPGPRAWFGAQRSAAPPPEDSRVTSRQLHPFLGYVRTPGRSGDLLAEAASAFPEGVPTRWARENDRVNAFGFLSSLDDYRAIPASDYAVGVFGGSVARELAVIGGEKLRDEVARVLSLPPASVVIVNAAAGGYKQPQQLLVLLQLLALGVELDLVINLDGFNEVATGGRDARRAHHPLFPSLDLYGALRDLTGAHTSEAAIVLSAAVLRERRAAGAIARRVESSWLLGGSQFARALLGSLALRHERRAAELESELQDVASAPALSDLARLADPCMEGEARCTELIADLWERSSLLMHATARDVGARYLHVLQPTRLIEGPGGANDSAPARARLPGESDYRAWQRHQRADARVGYPVLRQRGRRLVAAGVAFHDLTGVFGERSRRVYRDCCHVTLEGNEILASAIAARLAGPAAGPAAAQEAASGRRAAP